MTNFKESKAIALIAVMLTSVLLYGCSTTSKPIRKVTKPVDKTEEELVKIRELKNDQGETRAVISPADEKKLKITF